MEVAAFYFPNYHVDPHNETWHGRGWTEWELVKSARPRYAGHAQPKVPALGYFDESDPAVSAMEIGLAADHGITAFLYDWYWHEDGAYLQGALENGFLNAPNRERLKFGLMWANHDWLNIFPADKQNKPALLAPGRISPAGFDRLADYVIARYFRQGNYLKLEGKPYFCIYELGTFIDGMGGVEEARGALNRFRAKAERAGFPGLHVHVMVWGFSVLPGELAVADPVELSERLGVSSVGTYAWVHHYDPNQHAFPKGSYADAARANTLAWKEWGGKFRIPYHPNVSMGWDSSPRTQQDAAFEPRGYPWTAILEGNTPAAFERALRDARDFTAERGYSHPMVTINAWNEWTEGSYLLPDTVNGTAYLEAVRKVFGPAK